MRRCASYVVAAVTLTAACGTPPAPPASTAVMPTDALNAARVSRARIALPSGYEVADLAGPSTPLAFWGFGPAANVDPPECSELTDVGSDAAPAQGWSASGPGGIVYAVVADEPTELDPARVAACASWSVSAGHTWGRITTVGAPDVDRAVTVGMVAEATTRVENGTETHSRATTFNAYLGGHVASTTVVTDPGSTDSGLGPDFAARLLADVVAALRGG